MFRSFRLCGRGSGRRPLVLTITAKGDRARHAVTADLAAEDELQIMAIVIDGVREIYVATFDRALQSDVTAASSYGTGQLFAVDGES